MSTPSRQRVRFVAPEQTDVITESAPSPSSGEVRVRTRYSAISPGTERLVYQGNVPQALEADHSIDALQEEDFSYPLSYGYACVGEVEEVGKDVSSDWDGARVFSFQPHVSRFVATPGALVRLPDSVSLRDAALLPSVETAVTLVMDGRPMIGETVTVLGQGVVGLLTVQLLAQHPVASLHAVDPVEARRSVSAELGAQTFSSAAELTETLQETLPDRSDLTYELTGTPSVLNDAIQATGYSGRVVVGSWYGTKSAPLNLGGHFHRSRLNIISSQVSTIDPSLRGRWTKDRRMSTVLDLLSELAPSRLITEQFPVEQAPEVYTRLVSDRSLLQPLFVYD